MKNYLLICGIAAVCLTAIPAAFAQSADVEVAAAKLPSTVLMAPTVEVSVHTYRRHHRRYRVVRRVYYRHGRRIVVWRRFYY